MTETGPSAEEVASVIAFARNCWNHRVGRYSHDYDQFKVMMERRRRTGASMDCAEERAGQKGQEEHSSTDAVGINDDTPGTGNASADPWADEATGGEDDVWAFTDGEAQWTDNEVGHGDVEEGSLGNERVVGDAAVPIDTNDNYQAALRDLERAEAAAERRQEERERELAEQLRQDEEERRRELAQKGRDEEDVSERLLLELERAEKRESEAIKLIRELRDNRERRWKAERARRQEEIRVMRDAEIARRNRRLMQQTIGNLERVQRQIGQKDRNGPQWHDSCPDCGQR